MKFLHETHGSNYEYQMCTSCKRDYELHDTNTAQLFARTNAIVLCGHLSTREKQEDFFAYGTPSFPSIITVRKILSRTAIYGNEAELRIWRMEL